MGDRGGEPISSQGTSNMTDSQPHGQGMADEAAFVRTVRRMLNSPPEPKVVKEVDKGAVPARTKTAPKRPVKGRPDRDGG